MKSQKAVNWCIAVHKSPKLWLVNTIYEVNFMKTEFK